MDSKDVESLSIDGLIATQTALKIKQKHWFSQHLSQKSVQNCGPQRELFRELLHEVLGMIGGSVLLEPLGLFLHTLLDLQNRRRFVLILNKANTNTTYD